MTRRINYPKHRKQRWDAGIPKVWTQERVVEAIQLWERKHGEPPRVNEWFRAEWWHPQARTVKDRFGTWNAAISAAGFEPRPSYTQRWRETRAAA